MNRTVTQEVTDADAHMQELAREVFPSFYSVIDEGEHSLSSIVSAEFDVCALLYALQEFEATNAAQYRPGVGASSFTMADYEAAHVLAQGDPGPWELGYDLATDGARAVEEFGMESARNGQMILDDSSTIADLLYDYFTLAAVSETNARAQLVEFLDRLDNVDRALRNAGWDL